MNPVLAMAGRHIVEFVTSPTHVWMFVKVESITSAGEVPAQAQQSRVTIFERFQALIAFDDMYDVHAQAQVASQ